jgi:RNA polymerase sigma factor (TIGR02999 family)
MQVAQITKILNKNSINNNTWNEILPIVYNQLKVIARNVKFGHKKQQNLNTTSLVHEAYIKMQKHEKLNIEGTKHFYRLAAMAMRQILVDAARAKLRIKRQQDEPENRELTLEINQQIHSSNEIIEIDKALSNLEELNPRLAEIVVNHFYGGYTFDQIGEMLNISKRTALRDWKKAKAFIFAQLT